MHDSIPALFNAMAHVSVYASELFYFPKVNMLSPAYFHCHDAQVTLPLCHICLRKTDKFPHLLHFQTSPYLRSTETSRRISPHTPLPSPLCLSCWHVSPCSHDGCFLTRPTSHCLYLCLSAWPQYAGRLTSIALFASLCVSCQVELCRAQG